MKKLTKIALMTGMLMLTIFAVGTAEPFSETVEASSIFPGDINEEDAMQNPESKNIITKIFGFANIFAGIVLALSIVMIILGGLRYILAAGDQRAAEQGKMILIYSAIGILIALSAFALGRFFSDFAV